MFLFNKGLSLEKDYQVGVQSNHIFCLSSSCIYSYILIVSIYLTYLELQYSCCLSDRRQKLRVPLPFPFSLLLQGLLAIMLNKESTRSRARSRNDNNVGAEIGQNNINANAAQSATAWAAAVLAELPGGDIVAGTHFNQLQANLPSTAFICDMSCRPGVLLAVGVAGGDRVVCMANARRFMARSSRGQLATQPRRHKLAPTAANRCRQQGVAGGAGVSLLPAARRGQFGHLTRSYLLPRADA